MRMFGKFLVYTTLILSLIFFAWAGALYSQRLDWAPHKSIFSGEINKESGKLYLMHEEIKKLLESRDLAEQRWQTDATILPQLEGRRVEYREWYADQISLALTGRDRKTKDVKPPVIVLKRDEKDGLLIIDPKQREAVKSRDEEVKSIATYTEEYAKLKTDLETVQKEIDELVKKNEELTNLIAGIPGKTRGVRGDLEARINYKRLFEDEMKELKPKLIAQRINLEQQKERLVQLTARLKELQGIGQARK